MPQFLTPFVAVLLQGTVLPPDPPQPMTFSWLNEDLDSCNPNRIGDCTIVARGIIEADSAEKFDSFLAISGLSEVHRGKVPIELSSEGGDVAGAMELGRRFRDNGFDVTLKVTERDIRVCPGDAVYGKFKSSAEQPESDVTVEALAMRQGSTDGCFMIAEIVEQGVCLSACNFAFAGGVSRRLSGYLSIRFPPGSTLNTTVITGHYTDIDRQTAIGFHAISPVAQIESTPGLEDPILMLGARWGQREMQRAGEYFSEMGIDREVLSFFTKQPTLAEESDFYFPSRQQLEQAGLLTDGEVGRFLNARLEPVDRSDRLSLALVWRNRDLREPFRQISLFCSDDVASQSDFVFSLSVLGYRFPDSNFENVKIGLDQLEIPPSAGPEQYMDFSRIEADGPSRSGWTASIITRDGFELKRQYGLVDKGGGWQFDQETHQGPVYQVTQSDRSSEHRLRHFIFGLSQEDMRQILSSDRMTVKFETTGRVQLNISIDDDLRSAINALSRACL